MIAALPRSSAEMPLPAACLLEVAWRDGIDDLDRARHVPASHLAAAR